MQLSATTQLVDTAMALIDIHVQGSPKAYHNVIILVTDHITMLKGKMKQFHRGRIIARRPINSVKYCRCGILIPFIAIQMDFPSSENQTIGKIHGIGFSATCVFAELFQGEGDFHLSDTVKTQRESKSVKRGH
jgi:hypothetical protein